ncbi:1-deoxy-D-xylulose-5-phosphate synthase [Campylobacter sp. 2018MI35]|uniref:1-deoxy-D-xylulose-5-phosphate synthase n=1 Tax=Campylobacter molothri TaxID=1032242 RepID=UPI001905F848|nr:MULTISPECIES: 1-deoxy-D-xylulose-5-phosphate synthase [unclassified Campylobacter]MBZ7949560.1 1-deoxy-D-xylulose-5-phosphate synthase [Campylobacter sp. RM10534]MBZ7969712.1 1-deoxy-D-xylulose-5-phosphate synthase [Campylobacter sp. RM3125]MBZ7971086.1 1-deoxy-D-xylulose-5-phosphate synthase [Campylobacter sp. RM3124]MBK2000583.1 1-deoxy-D-xylulose-5-phosphate synthase [Campylobacter sp. 2018MI35]ULN99306.1 1-deoxyxylulose-5-phosphate synthase [Campylobacter sp. RM10537]
MNEIFTHTQEKLQSLSIKELENLAQKIREEIIKIVSKNGGHLSSNLGAVELTIAMHTVFDAKNDPFIFDVSHQSYTHKLLSGKEKIFHTLRQIDGLSGYTKPSEGDYFIAGHSSTSISLAVGACKAIALKNEKRIPVALIGDGALSAGMAYEALNELGDSKFPCVIILNDNEMSISKPIGAISKYLSQAMATQFYQNFKKRVVKMLDVLPDSATYMAKRFEESFRLITPGLLFEELGLEYIGPINGHNLTEIISALKQAKAMQKPCVIHAQTLKGKGYALAEGQHSKWHGVGAFDINSGELLKKSSTKSATEIFSQKLLELATKYENIVGVTAAMPSGTGLDKLIEKFPKRFWDVAIAEQHAVTSMAAMAREGFKPFIAIYSTFLQRAYDQVIHDCAIMNLNVVFAMDRAGIVGEDGETHQGVFDVSFLAPLPHLTLVAPRDELMMENIIEYAYFHKGPLAFRYPRGSFILDKEFNPSKVELGKAQWLIKNEKSEIAFIGYGQGVGKAWQVLNEMQENIDLIDLIFAKPLDEMLLKDLAKKSKIWFVFSENAKIGGVASLLQAFIQKNDLEIKIISFEYEDEFIEHGKTSEVEKKLKLDIESIIEKIKLYL